MRLVSGGPLTVGTVGKSIPGLALALFVQAACAGSAFAQAIVQDCESEVSLEGAMVVPFEVLEEGHLVVPVEVSGLAARAVVDTAALGIGGVISGELEHRLAGMEGAGPAMTVHGAHGGGAMQSRVLDVTVDGGPGSQGQLFIVAEDFPVPGADVILGSRFLCQFLLEFDLGKSQLTFQPRSTEIAQDGGWMTVPFEDVLGSGGIRFDMTLDGTVIPAVLDTGSPFTAVNWAAAEAAGIDRNAPGMVEKEFPSHGLMGDGPVTASLHAASLALPGGQFLRNDPDVRINDAPVYQALFQGGPGILLGLDFLHGRKFRIDHARELLYFAE